jgi:hypothetical protein
MMVIVQRERPLPQALPHILSHETYNSRFGLVREGRGVNRREMKIDHFSWYNSGWSSLLVADSMAWHGGHTNQNILSWFQLCFQLLAIWCLVYFLLRTSVDENY